MSSFDNATIIKAANLYFEGKVSSRSLTLADGSSKSLGLMQVGDYEFGTAKREIMEILSGELEVKLPGADSWIQVRGGGSFEVPANASFQVKVSAITDYCCSYLD